MTKEELISGIEQFWGSVSGEKCCKYIRHLQKVIPKVIEVGGAAKGYWFIIHNLTIPIIRISSVMVIVYLYLYTMVIIIVML